MTDATLAVRSPLEGSAVSRRLALHPGGGAAGGAIHFARQRGGACFLRDGVQRGLALAARTSGGERRARGFTARAGRMAF